MQLGGGGLPLVFFPGNVGAKWTSSARLQPARGLPEGPVSVLTGAAEAVGAKADPAAFKMCTGTVATDTPGARHGRQRTRTDTSDPGGRRQSEALWEMKMFQSNWRGDGSTHPDPAGGVPRKARAELQSLSVSG